MPKWTELVFTVQHHASTVYAIVVCLSVTSRYSAEKAKCRITQTTPQVSQGTLVFCAENLGKIQMGSPSGGAKCRCGRLKLATFDK